MSPLRSRCNVLSVAFLPSNDLKFFRRLVRGNNIQGALSNHQFLSSFTFWAGQGSRHRRAAQGESPCPSSSSVKVEVRTGAVPPVKECPWQPCPCRFVPGQRLPQSSLVTGTVSGERPVPLESEPCCGADGARATARGLGGSRLGAGPPRLRGGMCPGEYVFFPAVVVTFT